MCVCVCVCAPIRMCNESTRAMESWLFFREGEGWMDSMSRLHAGMAAVPEVPRKFGPASRKMAVGGGGVSLFSQMKSVLSSSGSYSCACLHTHLQIYVCPSA